MIINNNSIKGYAPPLTVIVYLRLPQMKSLEPLIFMVHSVLQTCSAGGLRSLWNVSTVGIQSPHFHCLTWCTHCTVALCWHKPGICTLILPALCEWYVVLGVCVVGFMSWRIRIGRMILDLKWFLVMRLINIFLFRSCIQYMCGMMLVL